MVGAKKQLVAMLQCEVVLGRFVTPLAMEWMDRLTATAAVGPGSTDVLCVTQGGKIGRIQILIARTKTGYKR